MTSNDPLGLTGQAFGEYLVGTFRGSGSFGMTYEAVHLPSRTKVALKILKPGSNNEQVIREFANEGDMLAKLRSARGVVNILDSSTENIEFRAPNGYVLPLEYRYHVLELADGSLDELVANLSGIDWPGRLRILRDITLGVHQLHSNKMVHRDLKPANCLYFRNGRGRLVKIADLGRSRDLSRPPSVLDYQHPRGDDACAPPELLCGLGEDSAENHIRTDLYGLGSIFFELAIGLGINSFVFRNNNDPFITLFEELDVEQRHTQYDGRIAELRGRYEQSFETFEASVPPPIKQPAGKLLRQLCDPEPKRRLPIVAPGRRALRTNDLQWLLKRVDIMIRILDNDPK